MLETTQSYRYCVLMCSRTMAVRHVKKRAPRHFLSVFAHSIVQTLVC